MLHSNPSENVKVGWQGMPFTFIAHAGLPPGYSHTCQTPWSVFLDGSFAPIPSAGAPRATSQERRQRPRLESCDARSMAADPARPEPHVRYAQGALRSPGGLAHGWMKRAEAGCNRVSSCQFQALFDSLFKVLCIFPSRYLFAIGLSPIFSFRWNLPPTSSCNPKQPDSTRTHRAATHRHGTGFSPSPISCSKEFERRARPMALF